MPILIENDILVDTKLSSTVGRKDLGATAHPSKVDAHRFFAMQDDTLDAPNDTPVVDAPETLRCTAFRSE